MELSREDNSAHAQRPVPCDACEDEVPGICYCIQCKKTLCQECEKSHGKFTKGHNVIPRAKLGDIDTALLNCAGHEEQAIFHCGRCNVPVCSECVIDKHQEHKLVDLEKTFGEKKSLLQKNINLIQGEILSDLEKRKEEILIDRTNYERGVQKVTNHMENEYCATLKGLEDVNTTRIKDINSFKKSHILMFDRCALEVEGKIEICKTRVSMFQDAIKKNSMKAVFHLTERILPLPRLDSKPELPKPPLMEPQALQHMSLSSILLKPNWQREPDVICSISSLFQDSTSIFITKNNEVWLGGYDSKELVMVDIKGTILKKRNIQTRPNALAVTDGGDIIVSPHLNDARSVKRISRENETEQHVFQASSSYHGVSITLDMKILICTKNGTVVKVDCDGNNDKIIYKGKGDDSVLQAIEIADGNIYISDRKNSKIILVNKDGVILLSIYATTDGEKLKRPTGLAIDKLGNILCADKEGDCVYIIDKRNLMRKLVGNSHGIQKPRWLAVDNDNNLWITQYDGTVNVAKYSV